MLLFLISALRAIIEMLGLCLCGQAILYLLAGQGRSRNGIYQLFALITRGPRQMVAYCLPTACSPKCVAAVTLVLLATLWLGLAFLRKYA